jgi:2-polyprenyl-3-methyl-5-hydroxy-6-metoxy-1,4-benzoquinol methylase
LQRTYWIFIKRSRAEIVTHDYGWSDTKATCAHAYLLPVVLRSILREVGPAPRRLVDLGCGNGYVAGQLAAQGYLVKAIDASADGIALGLKEYPELDFRVASIYDDKLADQLGSDADCVIALEVIEHLYYPRELYRRANELLKPGGALVLSTPYHGYLKNLAMAAVNAWDRHLTASWDGGHIKFFSKLTLCTMAREFGFIPRHWMGVGRLPWLWKSMVFIASKPGTAR